MKDYVCAFPLTFFPNGPFSEGNACMEEGEHVLLPSLETEMVEFNMFPELL